MINKEIHKLAHEKLIKSAAESIKYVACGKVMARDIAEETGITEDQASILLAVTAGGIISELDKLNERWEFWNA